MPGVSSFAHGEPCLWPFARHCGTLRTRGGNTGRTLTTNAENPTSQPAVPFTERHKRGPLAGRGKCGGGGLLGSAVAAAKRYWNRPRLLGGRVCLWVVRLATTASGCVCVRRNLLARA